MMEKLLAWFAALVLAGFLGILLWEIWRLDLGMVIATAFLLAIWDILRQSRRSG